METRFLVPSTAAAHLAFAAPVAPGVSPPSGPSPSAALPEHSVIQALAALAQPSRLRVFRTLVVAGPLGLTPGALSAELGVAAATLSFHLKELVHAGLVSQQRDGRNLIYRAAYAQMNAVLAYLTHHCCQGEACLLTPSTTSPTTPNCC